MALFHKLQGLFVKLFLSFVCCRKDGYLYDKEAIISYILQKKKEIARKLKEFEKQKQKAKV